MRLTLRTAAPALALITLASAATTFAKPSTGNVKVARAGTPDTNPLLREVYQKYKGLKEGKNADYIPALAEVDSSLFGIALVTVDGQTSKVGDTDSPFSIQSISKVFTLALVVQEQGAKAIEDKVGVDPTGMVFNSIVAVDEKKGKEINPFVNPGAIATTSLVPGQGNEKFARILDIHEQFSGRQLRVNEPVYRSEAATNQRNQAIAMLMKAYDRMYDEPIMTTDVYTRQCAINVTAGDLAVMAATLANGGKNPITKKQVVSPETVEHVLAEMAIAGLYDDAGIWLYNVGLPAKSGVGGGIIAVAPGKFGIAAFSPPLDEAGNSVRAQKAIKEIVDRMGANPYLVTPQ